MKHLQKEIQIETGRMLAKRDFENLKDDFFDYLALSTCEVVFASIAKEYCNRNMIIARDEIISLFDMAGFSIPMEIYYIDPTTRRTYIKHFLDYLFDFMVVKSNV